MWGATNDTPNKMAPVCGEIESPSNLSRKSGKKLLLKWQWNTWKKNQEQLDPRFLSCIRFFDACSWRLGLSRGAKGWQIFVWGLGRGGGGAVQTVKGSVIHSIDQDDEIGRTFIISKCVWWVWEYLQIFAGHKVEYGPPDWPIKARIVTQRYNKPCYTQPKITSNSVQALMGLFGGMQTKYGGKVPHTGSRQEPLNHWWASRQCTEFFKNTSGCLMIIKILLGLLSTILKSALFSLTDVV